LGPARSGDDPELDFGLAHERCGDGYAVVTGHRSFEAPAESGSVDGGDDWLRGFLDAVQDGVEAGSTPALAAGGHFSELADIGSGDEGAAAADQHDRLYRIILFELLYAGGDSFRHTRTQGVYWGIIYSQYPYVAVSAGQHQIAHKV
jgi:hypothetical protein